MTESRSESVAVVTGAARGIGLAIAERLLADGHRVVAIDLDGAKLTEFVETRAAGGAKVEAVVANVADPAAVASSINGVMETWNRIDVLVNCAGIAGKAAPIEEQELADWDTMIAVDLSSVFYFCQAVIPHMKVQRSGRIVNIASISGKEGNPNMVPYSTAKAGVIGLTKALAKEVANHGVMVNSVAPAVIHTEILDQLTPAQVDYMVQRIPVGRPGRPEEVAALVSWMASEECSFTTGFCFDISGGRATY